MIKYSNHFSRHKFTTFEDHVFAELLYVWPGSLSCTSYSSSASCFSWPCSTNYSVSSVWVPDNWFFMELKADRELLCGHLLVQLVSSLVNSFITSRGMLRHPEDVGPSHILRHKGIFIIAKWSITILISGWILIILPILCISTKFLFFFLTLLIS